MLDSAKPSVVAQALDPVGNPPDHIAQDTADRTVVVGHTGDTAGTVEGSADTVNIAGIAAAGDTVPIGHSLFAVLQWMLEVGGRIRSRN